MIYAEVSLQFLEFLQVIEKSWKDTMKTVKSHEEEEEEEELGSKKDATNSYSNTSRGVVFILLLFFWAWFFFIGNFLGLGSDSELWNYEFGFVDLGWHDVSFCGIDGKNSDKANAIRSKHSVTEQRRRSKINERYNLISGWAFVSLYTQIYKFCFSFQLCSVVNNGGYNNANA